MLELGHAYLTHGTVYFDVSTFPRFGKLSHYSEDQMVKLARARGGNPDDPHRRQPLDFVLWQPSLADEPAWRAPFGVGRPGWHIECSAMAMHEHGPTLDLHGGGTDLIFPHHECEIAQSESLTGEPFARHWLHSAMVNYEGEKMSKSLGNLVFVSDLLKVADPRAIRLALMRHHYRHGFEWYDTDLEEGTALLHRLLAAAERPTGPDPRRSPSVCATRSTTTSTRRARSTRSTTSPSAILSGGDDPTAHRRVVRARPAARRRPRTADRRYSPTGRAVGSLDRIASPVRRLSEQITVTLPDGSHRSRAAARRRPTSRRRSGPGSRRPRSPPRPTASGSISRARSSTTRTLADRRRPTSDDGREVLRHSTAHVMAEAVTRLFPGAKYAIGPAIADGFYYDFELPGRRDVHRRRSRQHRRRDAQDREGRPTLRARGAELRRRAAGCSPTSPTSARSSRRCAAAMPTTRTRARRAATARRVGVPQRRANGDVDFVDLCRGPHVPSTGKLGAFKLTKVAGAYWRGNEKGPMLQRIYGTAWESKDALDEHLHRLEEAEQRDHRKLGVELDLFSFPEEIGSGLAVFHPKGALVRRIMEEYSRQASRERRATSS